MKGGFHIVHAGLDVLSLILPTMSPLSMSPDPNAKPKSSGIQETSYLLFFLYHELKYKPHFSFFLLLKREEISVPNSL